MQAVAVVSFTFEVDSEEEAHEFLEEADRQMSMSTMEALRDAGLPLDAEVLSRPLLLALIE